MQTSCLLLRVIAEVLLQAPSNRLPKLPLFNSINGINKHDDISWDEIKHIIISLINDFYSSGKEYVIEKDLNEETKNLKEIEKKIVKLLDEKIRPAVAKDGGDIKFKKFENGTVKVQLQGSCSGCPSSTMTLKQGVQNLLCHYIPEVKKVEAV